MTLELKQVQLIPRTIQAIEYTEQNGAEVRQWIQDRVTMQEVVRDQKTGRLYLPLEGDTLDIVEYGEFILYDGQSFRSTTAEAMDGYYMEVE